MSARFWMLILVCRLAVLPANVTGRRIALAKCLVFLHRERVDVLMLDQHIRHDGRFPLEMTSIRGPGQLTGNQLIGPISSTIEGAKIGNKNR